MKLAKIGGIIQRRILVNYRIAPEVIQPLLPPKFAPKLHLDYAMAGICLIRLEKIAPFGLSGLFGAASENAAHRVAVIWHDASGKSREGVYVIRRDTNSRLNQMAGGRLFPGEHHAAKFRVTDDGDRVDLEMTAADDLVVQVRGKKTDELPHFSGFNDLAEASAFFKAGSLGYSATHKGDRLEGIMLKTAAWKVEPMHVEHLYSSFFSDQKTFPPDSILFDCALIMRNIPHEWHGEEDLHL